MKELYQPRRNSAREEGSEFTSEGKLKRLKEILTEMESVLVAYSGGVDSAFVMKVANDVLGDKVLAVTASSSVYPSEEIEQAKALATDSQGKTQDHRNPGDG